MTAIETTRDSAKANNRDAAGRLTFLDWTRGLAATIMLQGHVFHSFTRNSLRTEGPYVLSQFFGGLGPAIFLVLTGVTFGFLMDRRQKQELPPMRRWLAALRRSGYLFLLAFLFRFQLWLFAAGQSPWWDIFKVDVLNCMGLTLALLSVMAIFTTADRVRLCAVLGIVMAAASPVISSLDFTWLPPNVSNYFVPNFNYFSIFPWGAFIAFGVSIGSLLRLVKPEDMGRVMQWGTLAGLGLIAGGQYFANFPASIYPKSDFWLNSPLLIFIKLGVVLVTMGVAYVWTEYGVKNRFSWVRQLGTTSLLVYWVHIELVYGRWFGSWKESLSTPQVVACAVTLIACMIGLSVLKTRWSKLHWPSLFAPHLFSPPSRVSGD